MKSFVSLKVLFILFFNILNANSYNSLGQTGLINLPSADTHNEQSVYLTFKRDSYSKLGTLTVTPFDWMEASYFYYRPDDLLWGKSKGLYLDKGFNVKFLYKPKSNKFPSIAVGLDDFAGTGMFTKEYFVTTYEFNNIKVTAGIGWGKFNGKNTFRNPLSLLSNHFETRPSESENYSLGGRPSTDQWFRGDASAFGGLEVNYPFMKNISLKIESNPFDYFEFGCCGEGLSGQSFVDRISESNINYGLSYKYKENGNIDFSFVKGNTWNINFSIGFSSSKPLRKKNKFKPLIENIDYKQSKKEEFYLDILHNLNRNKLFLQTANAKDRTLELTIDSEEYFNPIIYSSRAAYIAKEVGKLNDYQFENIAVGHITRGSQINYISYRTKDLDLKDRYPDVLIKKNSKIKNSEPNDYVNHEFKPRVIFPNIAFNLSPDFRTHIGSPEQFLYSGFGIKFTTEIQLNRRVVLYSNIGKSFYDNFGEKVSDPSSALEHVRTDIVDYLQQSTDDIYISNLEIERIWSPRKNLYLKSTVGILESMYGGIATEMVYKPFNQNFLLGLELNSIKKRDFNQQFSFSEYETDTYHTNIAYYHPATNIRAKWSYGTYLAGDKGYTLDLSRRMPSGWTAGFFFSRTNVSEEEFGEGSFDKGFYINIPTNIFSKNESKNINGLALRTMTRDGGQKLQLRNRLIDSFYGSTKKEINENWNSYLD